MSLAQSGSSASTAAVAIHRAMFPNTRWPPSRGPPSYLTFSVTTKCARFWRQRQRTRGVLSGGAMLRTFVLVLYCTGLRLGEAARLRMVDVDLDRGLSMVQASKGRSRIVPIRADLAAEIRCYVAERQQVLNRRGRDDHG